MVKRNIADEPKYEPQHDLQPGRNGTAAESLLSFVERLERLAEEKAGITADMTEVRAEAKGQGFDSKVINRLIAWRKQDPSTRQESDAAFEMYKDAVAAAEKKRFNKSVAEGA